MPEESRQLILAILCISFSLHLHIIPSNDSLNLLWCHFLVYFLLLLLILYGSACERQERGVEVIKKEGGAAFLSFFGNWKWAWGPCSQAMHERTDPPHFNFFQRGSDWLLRSRHKQWKRWWIFSWKGWVLDGVNDCIKVHCWFTWLDHTCDNWPRNVIPPSIDSLLCPFVPSVF